MSSPSQGVGLLGNLKTKLLVSLILGLAVLAGLTFFADFPKMMAALRQFDWRLLPVALFFVFWNYLLRFAKWHYYLAQIGVRSLPLKDSALLFLGGLSMVVTP
ncbi:MAG: lysylphosphatidylglycerol synthase domain-containing protein, partial [Chloroflexota bacterium]